MKLPRIKLKPVGKCIYCGSSISPLRTEHIIPLGLNGPWELPRASCDECAKITSAFENTVLRSSLIVLRAALDFPTRRKKQRPKLYPLTITRNGISETVEVPVHESLAAMILPIYELPAHIDGRPYKSGISIIGVIAAQVGGPPVQELAKKYGTKTISVTATWKAHTFERMLAKIAYGFCVSQFGLANIDSVYVLPAILGQKDDVGRWVGCANDIQLPIGQSLHQIHIALNNREIIVRIKLFALFNVPEYLVVVGTVSQQWLDQQVNVRGGA